MGPKIIIPGREEQLANYAAAIRHGGGRPVFTLRPAAPRPGTGLLLPGGGDLDPALYGQVNLGSHPADRERDRLELTLAEAYLAAGLPVLGICRGLQVVWVVYGGALMQHVEGHGQQDGRDSRHTVTAEPGSLARELWGREFPVNSAHHQAAGPAPAGLRVTARAGDGVIEAAEATAAEVWLFQFHPERMTGPELPGDGGLFRRFCRKLKKTP